MSTQLLPRFTLRLLVPALALSAIALLGEPLPAPAQENPSRIVQVEFAGEADLAAALQHEAELLRQEAELAKKAARQTASQMRWFLTLPAAGRRCSIPGCAS
jgi:hypothetical protein